jgi:hypothetical protein
MTSNGSGSLTFKWLTGILVSVLIILSGILLADTKTNLKEVKLELAQRAQANQEKIECLQREKVDKEQYYRDISEIKQAMKDQAVISEKIMDKLEKIRMIR